MYALLFLVIFLMLFFFLTKETIFGIKATTIKMFVPKNQKRRVEQQETTITKRVEKDEAFLRKNAYQKTTINVDNSFFDDSDLENKHYFLVLVYHIKTNTPLLSCRYYFDKSAILKAISGDENKNETDVNFDKSDNLVFLADRLSGNTNDSVYKKRREIIFAFFYNEILKNNNNKTLLLMARSDDKEKLLTKYLRLGFNVIGNTKHKGIKHWIVSSELNESYSFLKRNINLFLFLKLTRKKA